MIYLLFKNSIIFSSGLPITAFSLLKTIGLSISFGYFDIAFNISSSLEFLVKFDSLNSFSFVLVNSIAFNQSLDYKSTKSP